ncbi:MAG TPA: class II fructose-1,6-bisphosphate aldolase [candidate division WOR-3 bacterium]|uniref:Class II fructose-1,6-bisphosphate aldolase n=1 Tax=candidate division WOR-3 bacterium TaxID=2052148 RepID=A0A7V0LTZ4_UNCW3|nr:class II fructose-1,6-bisphosphate aldolase [candidate division WOR-3 bacterium]
MALVTMKEILEDAGKRSYGVGAFNINNLEFLQAIIEAAEEENSPVIIAISEGAMKYGWVELLSTMVKTAAMNTKVPVALHLDHGKNFDKILTAIRYGFTSIMIDASDKSYEENVKLTKEVIKVAHPLGITVEAELGRLLGKEDEVESDVAIYTDPDDAKRFVDETEIDALAVAVGTSHGAYKFKGEAKLDIERIKKINSLTGVPLVLHGASGVPHELVEEAQKYGAVLKGAKGVPNEEIKKAIEAGIRKINIDTDLRISFLLGVRKYLSEHPEIFDPRKYLGEGRAQVKETVKKKMQLFGSSGKA